VFVAVSGAAADRPPDPFVVEERWFIGSVPKGVQRWRAADDARAGSNLVVAGVGGDVDRSLASDILTRIVRRRCERC
jgi:hypothetical protein